MVCLGPRKREKRSPSSDAGSKIKPKLRNSKTNASLAPSVVSINLKKATPRLSLDSTTKKTTPLPKHPSQNSLLSNEQAPSPVHRSTSPHKPLRNSRPSSIISAKSNYTTLSARSPAASRAPSTASKKQPVNEMKEEVRDLKAKNEENMKLIADQKEELERLKQQLENSQSPVEEDLDLLKDKEEQLIQCEREIEELHLKLDQTMSPISMSPSDDSMAEILAQKEKLLEEKEAQLVELKRMMDEKVAKQLETLKLENLDAVNQLSLKEKELEELRSLINVNPKEEEKEEEKCAALKKIEELNKQLETQKKSHEEVVQAHEQVLAEKDSLLRDQQISLDALKSNHQEEVFKLKSIQSESIKHLELKYNQDKSELEKQLDDAREELENNPAVDMNEQLERILHEFEQADHTHAAQIQDLQQSHQSELSDLANTQKAQLNKLKRTQDLTRDKWTSRYLPTEAVSWPLPNGTSNLRPTALVGSRNKTLLRVLGNNTSYQPVLTPLDVKKVQVYYSSVSSSPVNKRNQEQIQQLLKNHDIKFSLVDVASSEAARKYAKKCNNNGRSYGRIKEFPQLYVGGEYRGQYTDVVDAIDDGRLEQLLKAAQERSFTPEERAAIQQAEMNQDLVVSMLPVETSRPTRSTAKQVRTLKDYDEDEELLKALEQEMKLGKVNFDDF